MVTIASTTPFVETKQIRWDPVCPRFERLDMTNPYVGGTPRTIQPVKHFHRSFERPFSRMPSPIPPTPKRENGDEGGVHNKSSGRSINGSAWSTQYSLPAERPASRRVWIHALQQSQQCQRAVVQQRLGRHARAQLQPPFTKHPRQHRCHPHGNNGSATRHETTEASGYGRRNCL